MTSKRHAFRISVGENREKEEAIFKEIMAGNFPQLMGKHQSLTRKSNKPQKPRPRDILKLTNMKQREDIKTNQREKTDHLWKMDS